MCNMTANRVDPFTCTFCGCLCDDLALTIDGGTIVEARNACDLARPRLVGLSTARGNEVGDDEPALARAVALLQAARAPVIVGLGKSSNETVGKAVALADRIGAVVQVGGPASGPRITAFQRGGLVSATLGEVKNRADVVVFWATDPVVTHPRHWERYSVEPVGRFTPEGRAGRTVVVIDRERTATAEKADVFLQVDPQNELELLWVLRGLARGIPMKESRIEHATACGVSDLKNVVELLKLARYGAWFGGPFAGRGPVAQAEARHQAVAGLVRDLNSPTSRFVAIGMGEAGNAHGAEAVLAWQTGLTPSVDLGAEFPEALPGATSGVERLARGEADCVVVVGDVTLDDWPDAARARLGSTPWIFVGPPESPLAASATVALAAATAGLDEDGTFTRVDGVSLPIRAVRDRGLPTEGDRLVALLSRIEASL
ncbi:formylmethanofuran dehydrogenase subunit B [Paludisphaera borealis]|uniref:formylmethanofuran dehydrogenase subunit B n=1 Tax=Paludisphaera borealis TaxID=1387353 RepID=UPI0028525D8A|nr:formylmethanofuran dehydrogenase subunit B [Paludisphaera borealis]